MKETWYYIDSGHQTPSFNMAVDECLLNWHSKGLIPPVLRLYGWKPAGLSIGYFQKTANKINLEKVEEKGFKLVRRLTGGRAVLHDDELTYSIIISEDHPCIPTSIKEAYLYLSKGILNGYQLLHIDASFHNQSLAKSTSSSAVCFEEPSWYELIVDGKKAAGSAQTRKNGVLLQHGSIPITINEEVLYDLFLYPSEAVKKRAQQGFKDKAISIQDVSSKVLSYDTVKTAFREGFEQALNLNLEPYQFNEQELTEIKTLQRDKYENDQWNLNR